MDKIIKADWLKALRSGRYKQGREYLCSGRPEYCCLGILAKIQGAYFDQDGRPFVDGEECVRPETPLSYLSRKLAAGVPFKTQKKLGNMNDGCGQFVGEPQTFKQIADYIEKHL